MAAATVVTSERTASHAERTLHQRLSARLRRRVRSLAVGLTGVLARVIPIRTNRIVFVSKRNVPITGNLRIVADALAERGGAEIAMYRDGVVSAEMTEALIARGIRVFAGFSLRAALYIASSSTVVLSHSARDCYLTHRRHGRRIINLWHGVALKRIELLMTSHDGGPVQVQRRVQMQRNSLLYDAVIASSPVDRLVNALAFGVPYDKVHAIGLPRFDYLCDSYKLPADLEAQRASLDQLLGSRRLVLFAPTFRDDSTVTSAAFDTRMLARLRALCIQEGLVFGFRAHPYECRRFDHLCDGDLFVSLDSTVFTEAALLLSRAEALVVDYSSIWVDFLVRRKTIIGFVPDIESYSSQDRGFIYNHESLFPGPLARDGDALLDYLTLFAREGFPISNEQRYAVASAQLLPTPQENGRYTAACLARLFADSKVQS